MRQYRNLAAVIVIAVILAGIYYLVSNKDSLEGQEAKSGSNTIKVMEIQLEQITEIDIDNKGEKFVLVKGPDKWSLTEPANIKYEQTVVEGMPLNLLYLSAAKVVTEKLDDPVEYGLAQPATISIKSVDGETRVLKIGNLTSTKDGYYAQAAGSEKVYTISPKTAASLLLTKNSIKDRNVLSLADNKKLYTRADDIKSLTLEREGVRVFSAQKDSEGKWLVTSPKKTIIDVSRINPILNAIVRVLALEFIDGNPADLVKYGLSKPAYGLEFEDSIGRKKLLIGDEKKAGSEFYATVEGSKDVFTLDETGFDFLDKPFKDIIGE